MVTISVGEGAGETPWPGTVQLYGLKNKKLQLLLAQDVRKIIITTIFKFGEADGAKLHNQIA